jgi:hypothetical protein
MALPCVRSGKETVAERCANFGPLYCITAAMGFGTWNLDPTQAEEAVAAALRHGYRHFDCAPIYDVRHLMQIRSVRNNSRRTGGAHYPFPARTKSKSAQPYPKLLWLEA